MIHRPLTNATPRRASHVTLTLLLLAGAGCASTHALSGDYEATAVLARLRERRDAIESAVYRVRWRAIGVEPHAEFILEIAYQAPEQYRIVATGPFGIPAFTAVVLGDDFTFINHRDGRYITDELAHLIDYEFPVAEFFEGPWRDLFGGGWGGSKEVEALRRKEGDPTFLGTAEDTEWIIRWNRGRNAPSRISARAEADSGILEADVWFEGYNSQRAPYWQMDRLVLRGIGHQGEHRWTMLKQDYNVALPGRFFQPLQPPREWEKPRN